MGIWIPKVLSTLCQSSAGPLTISGFLVHYTRPHHSQQFTEINIVLWIILLRWLVEAGAPPLSLFVLIIIHPPSAN